MPPNRMLNFLDDDEDEEMFDDDDFDDQPRGSQRRQTRNLNQTQTPQQRMAPEPRGAAFGDILEFIQDATNHGVKIADQLSKAGNVAQCERLQGLLERLEKLDASVDKDRRAVDETRNRHGKERDDGPVLQKHYKKIRKELKLDNPPGRNRQAINAVKERVTQIRDQFAGTGQPAAGADDSVQMDDEEEIQMVQYLSNKDPITKRPIQQPVKNPICNHVYDRASIQEYIKFNQSRRQLYQCPVEMCKNRQNLKMELLVPFPEFFERVRRDRSRSRSRSRSRTGRRLSRSRSRSPNQAGPSTSSRN